MRVLRVYVTGSSPVTCTKLKTRMKSKKFRFHAGFPFFFLKIFLCFKTYFDKIKPFFIKMQHAMQHAYHPSAKSRFKNFFLQSIDF